VQIGGDVAKDSHYHYIP